MKKKFTKPEIQRITLSFEENIVASYHTITHAGQFKSQDAITCLFVESGYYYSDVTGGNVNAYLGAIKGPNCFLTPNDAAKVARMLGI